MQPSNDRSMLAPWWHTVLVLLPLFAGSVLGMHDHGVPKVRLFGIAPRLSSYLMALAEQWLVFFLIWLWLRSQNHPLESLLRSSRRSVPLFLRDIGIGVAFLVVELPLTAVLSRLFHRSFDATVLLPHSALELAFWTVLACTAGFCEELIFRGYLMCQFKGWTRSAPIAVVLQGIAFGLVHGYQGKDVILVAFVGGLFGGLALWRRSLIPGMLAHAIQDNISGIVGFLSR